MHSTRRAGLSSLVMILFPVACVSLTGSIMICFMCIFSAERWRGARGKLFVVDEESSAALSGTYIDQFCITPEPPEKIKIHLL